MFGRFCCATTATDRQSIPKQIHFMSRFRFISDSRSILVRRYRSTWGQPPRSLRQLQVRVDARAFGFSDDLQESFNEFDVVGRGVHGDVAADVLACARKGPLGFSDSSEYEFCARKFRREHRFLSRRFCAAQVLELQKSYRLMQIDLRIRLFLGEFNTR